MKLELQQPAKNQAIVTLGQLEVFFSYGACIAFRAWGGDGPAAKAFNPRYRGFSQTTSKHATQLGCAGFPDAPSADEFDVMLTRAMGVA